AVVDEARVPDLELGGPLRAVLVDVPNDLREREAEKDPPLEKLCEGASRKDLVEALVDDPCCFASPPRIDLVARLDLVRKAEQTEDARIEDGVEGIVARHRVREHRGHHELAELVGSQRVVD